MTGAGPDLDALRAAVARAPRDPEGHYLLGRALAERGYVPEGITHLRWAVELAPSTARYHTALGVAHHTLGDLEAALTATEQALALDPDNERAAAEKASILEMRGDLEAARALVHPRLKGGKTHPVIAGLYARLARAEGKAAEAVPVLEQVLQRSDLPPELVTLLHHALGDLLGAGGDDVAAFEHYRRGNEAEPNRFDPDRHDAWVDRIAAAFPLERVARMPKASGASPLPVFVVGMPRSGTTLVEQILASHPEGAGAGELPDVIGMTATLPGVLGVSDPYPECVSDLDPATLDRLAEGYLGRRKAAFPAARRVVDKMPQNFLHLGLIALLFPKAHVVHCVRDPLDTCLSCYTTAFAVPHDYARNLENLGRYYRAYARLMAHWRRVFAALGRPQLELLYEDMVTDQEARTRALLEFVGLPWDERCLRFHETRRDVGTASYDQVRRPIYNTSIGRWKRFERHLGPLQEALGDVSTV
jgi:Flp pilus assembly protein TadD